MCATARPSSGDEIKVLVPSARNQAARALENAGARRVADRGAYTVYSAPAGTTLPDEVERRDDFDRIELHRRQIDTSSSRRSAAKSRSATGLKLVQFEAPPSEDDLAVLADAGAKLVTYVPANAFLVWVDRPGDVVLRAEAARGTPIQFYGDFEAEDAIDPRLDSWRDAADEIDIVAQLTRAAPSATDDIARLRRLTTRDVGERSRQSDDYIDVHLRIAGDNLDRVAALASAVHIEPYVTPSLSDERQGQIVAGNLDLFSQAPTGPGYLTWLASRGFPSDPARYPIVAVVDDGVDNGATTPISPEFYRQGDSGSTSRIMFAATPPGSGMSGASGPRGHGTINASILAGYNDLTGSGATDLFGFHYGLGIAPFGRIGNIKIFFPGFNVGTGAETMVSDYYGRGARISNNSWGANVGAAYDTAAQIYDALTRDAQATTNGNQQMLFVFSAGNGGPATTSISSPASAKNVIAVGASESFNPDSTFGNGCGDTLADADNCRDLATFSSRGPTQDGRTKPDLVAPGTFIEGVAAQPSFTGAGVCGAAANDFASPGTDALFPPGSAYTWSSGTSHAAPAVAGAAAMADEFLDRVYGIPYPSPALLKAYLVHGAQYLNGSGGNDDLPSSGQGFGRADLGLALRTTAPRFLHDQQTILSGPGATAQFSGRIVDPNEPVRVVLAWTDAPGSTIGNAWVNDLDLTVTAGASSYRGNHFSKGVSVTGGSADWRNNVEAVFLPAGSTSGPGTITVTATTIAGDGVPGNSDTTDQDFALVAYNFAPVTAVASLGIDANAYRCDSTIHFDVADSNRLGAGIVSVAVVSSRGDVEIVTLTEAPLLSGLFSADLSATTANVLPANGALSVAHGGTVTATYTDVNAVLQQRTATVDCVAPSAAAINAGAISSASATVLVTSDEPSSAVLHYGTDCAELSSSIDSMTVALSHELTLSGLHRGTTYYYTVELTDVAGNVTTADNGGACYSLSTILGSEYFTEQFESGFDLANTSLTLTPSGSSYTLCESAASALPTNPAGGTALPLEDDSSLPINLSGGKRAVLYGQSYGTAYVGSNGYLTFGNNDDSSTEDLPKHFAMPRVAALFDDLDPGAAGGVSWRQLSDRVAVTYQGVPEFGLGGSNTFQIELFFNGVIRITYLGISANDGLAGLSAGAGVPGDFVASDLNAADTCRDSTGTISLNQRLYSCQDSIRVSVHDGDLAGRGTLAVLATSSGGDQEWVALDEAPAGSGTFAGSIAGRAAVVDPADGALDLDGGQSLSVTYVDGDDGTGQAANVSASAAVTCIDDFLFFSVMRSAGATRFYKFSPVSLAETLNTTSYQVSATDQLGVPAKRAGVSLLDATTRYHGYRVKTAEHADDPTGAVDLHLLNRCHEVYVKTTRPTDVILPAALDANSPVTPPSATSHDLDTMSCYKARVETRLASGDLAPGLPDGMQIDLTDELNGGDTRTYDLLKVTRLCVPTEVGGSPLYTNGPQKGLPKSITGSTVRDAGELLLCYRASLARKRIAQTGCVPTDPSDRGTPIEPRQPKHQDRPGLNVADAFGTTRVDSAMEQEICLPTVRLVEP